MRIVLFVVLGLATALLAAPRPGEARPYYPWCAQFTDRGEVRTCAYATQGQCLASVSGVGGYCFQNYAPPPSPPYAEARRTKPRRHAAPY
jgi:Protein of unknown function (DUF3551)